MGLIELDGWERLPRELLSLRASPLCPYPVVAYSTSVPASNPIKGQILSSAQGSLDR